MELTPKTIGLAVLVGIFGLWLLPLLIALAWPVGIIYVLAKYTPLGAPLASFYFKTYDWLFYQSEGPRKFLWKSWYNILCWLYPQQYWTCMNYGYAPKDGEGKFITLEGDDERERFCLQLYHHTATGGNHKSDLKSKKILEVGCGRGGGLNYLNRYLKAESCTGVDFSQTQVDFCTKNYASASNMKFVQGDAENLPFGEATFDLVVNVESSHCYGNMGKFVSEVSRVLKPNGRFCITDFRDRSELEALKATLTSTKLVLEKEEDITGNVIRALDLDEKRRTALISSFVHPFLQKLFIKFSGLKGSRIYDLMSKDETKYVVYVLRKPAA